MSDELLKMVVVVSIAERERERGFYIFSQPTRLYRCARIVNNLVRSSILSVYHV
jgi:hypothetical protein